MCIAGGLVAATVGIELGARVLRKRVSLSISISSHSARLNALAALVKAVPF